MNRDEAIRFIRDLIRDGRTDIPALAQRAEDYAQRYNISAYEILKALRPW